MGIRLLPYITDIYVRDIFTSRTTYVSRSVISRRRIVEIEGST